MKIIVVLCTLCCALPVPAIAGETGPDAPVTQLNQALLQSMRGGDELGFAGRYRLLAPVIEEVFALPLMARTAAGRFWRQMVPEQQERYLAKYKQWTITSYASRFDDYRGQELKTLENPQPANRTADVVSIFKKANGEEIVFNYKVIRSGDRWQIADVRVKGVSQLALTRTQFVDILGQKGLDGLLARLEEKIAEMAGGGESDLNTDNGS